MLLEAKGLPFSGGTLWYFWTFCGGHIKVKQGYTGLNKAALFESRVLLVWAVLIQPIQIMPGRVLVGLV